MFPVKLLLRGVFWFGAGLAVPAAALASPVFQYPAPVPYGAAQVENVGVVITAQGTVAEIRVVTQGRVGGDYMAAGGATCAVGQAYSTGQSCVFPIRFAPSAPGARLGAVLLLDSSGAVMATQMLYGMGIGSAGVLVPANMQTMAGNGTWVYRSDGVPALQASIFLPGGVAIDGAGNIVIADTNNNRLRLVDAVTGLISTIAGTGSPGSTGDNGPATSAAVSLPGAIVVNGAGDILFADSGNNAVRKLTLATGVLSTIAGQLGQPGASGDGGPATAAALSSPEGLAMDAAGNLLIADTDNQLIRRVDAVTGIITTVAGTGAIGFSGDGGLGVAAMLNTPWGIALDATGALYIADLGNNRIRRLSPSGRISTVAGTNAVTYNGDGQPASTANLKGPAAVAADVAGNIYVADSGNNRIRKIAVQTGLISTIAGTGDESFSGDYGPATDAGMYGPYALALDNAGNVYFSDIFHHRIRKLENSLVLLETSPIKVGKTSPPQPITYENDGNDVLHLTALALDNNSALDPASTTCAVATPLAVGDACVAGAEFSPQVVGNPLTALIQLQSDASNTPGVISLTGESDALEPTVTVVISSANPAALGSTVVFTASTTGGGTTPSGTMRFYDGTNLLATVSMGGTNAASYSTSVLTLGTHPITAAFTGDDLNSPSTSAVLNQVIRQTPTIALASSLNPSNVGAPITFTASLAGASTTPAGQIAFVDGSTVFGIGTLNASGVAAFTTAGLPAGSHSITANYPGDANTLSGTSAVLVEIVNKWSTSTLLSSNRTPATVGDTITLTIHVATTSTVPLSGTVSLQDAGNSIATLSLDGAGNASYTTSTLPVGSHALVASFAGDATNGASTSTTLTQLVQTVSSTVAVSSSANPANAGATVRLTATVTAATTNTLSGSPAGTVAFTDGAVTLGIGMLSAGGTATLDVTTFAVGTHTIVASYSGDPYHASAASTPFSQVVQLAVTMVQLQSSPNPSIAGRAVNFVATVSGNGNTPTGTVTFLDGGNLVGTGTVSPSGQATLSLSTLAAGTHTLTAAYGGDAKDSPATSSPLPQIVQQSVTMIALTSGNNPSFAGAAVTFLASLTANGSLPAGQIVLHEGASVLGSAAMNGSGLATFSVSTLSAGLHTLVATYAGDADHAASDSAALVQTVQIGTSAVALSSGKNPSIFGDTVIFAVNVTGTANQPGGSVSLLDGSTPLAVLPLSASGAASFSTSSLGIGDHPVTAVYSGDTTHAGSTSHLLTQRVEQATSMTVTSNNNPSIVGANVHLTATIAGASGAPISGTVSFADGATVLGTATVSSGAAALDISTLVAGTHLILATYSGDATNESASSAPFSQAVNVAGTSVTLTSSANPSVVGTAVMFSAAVVSLGKVPSGMVTFLDGSTILGTGTVANGVASFTTRGLVAGQHSIVARYGGDAGTQVSTSSVLVQVAQQATSLALSASPNPALTLQGITLTATLGNGASATGVVTFTDGGATLGSLALGTNGTTALTLPSLAAGSHSLVASYAGDSYNLPSASALLTEAVGLRPTTTATTASSDTYLSGTQVTLVGIVSGNGPAAPTGTVTFMSGTNSLGSAPLSAAGAATVTIFPVDPSYDIVAVYAGDAVYSGSTGTVYSIHSGPTTTFTMSASTSSLALASGAHSTFDITFTSVKGFTDLLALGCLELPIDATCTFSTDKMPLAANGTGVVHLTVDTGNPLAAGPHATLEAGPRPGTRAIQAAMLLPGAGLLGLLVLYRRRLKAPRLLFVAALLTSGMGISGCATNTLTQASTPAGSYTIRVVASGTQSGASQAIDMPLTVTR